MLFPKSQDTLLLAGFSRVLAPMEAAEAKPEATGSHGGAGRPKTGWKLVPWSSWAEWRFVRDGLFSLYPAAALRRIAAWRGKGCLPIPVDVTAAFVEIRLRDPFFQDGMTGDDTLESEETLRMLYSMAIIRLVNCFLENPTKKTGGRRRSIAESAKAVGIPRLLVDIRHEGSHSHHGLPSLRLLRLAAIKAFDWLKCTYWVIQTNGIPDAQVELRSRLHKFARLLKGTCSKDKSGSKRKRSEKLICRTIKYLRQLYYACPSEVASVLLDVFQLDAPESSENSDAQTESLDVNHSYDVQDQITNSDVKTIITQLSEKEPRLVLVILKSVIEMIENEDLKNKGESYAGMPAEPSKMKKLCSLLLWIVTNIKELKDSCCIELVHEMGVVSSDKNAVPRFCLAKLLQKCLSLSIIGERCIIDAALLLIEMIGDNNVKEKLRKLPVLSLAMLAKDCTLLESRIIANSQESVENATEQLEMFKLQLKKRKNVCLAENGTEGSFNTSTPEKHNRWSIAKSWTPCPMGMIPCSYSSTAVLPSLDATDHELKDTLEQHVNFEHDDDTGRFDCYSHPEKQLNYESIPKIPRSPECEISDMPELAFPLRGRLLVGGLWKKVTDEELLFIKSKMKILL